MVIHHGYKDLGIKNPVITMGIFDGVHLGHKFLIDILVSRAAEVRGESVIVTFHPHPRFVLENDGKGIAFLSTMEEKIPLLEKTGIDHLVIIEFTALFSRIKAIDFIERILVGSIGMKHLIVGYDHRFGRGGGGDYETIKSRAPLLNFTVEQVKDLSDTKGIISSSMIREALSGGRIEDANNWLGYNYTLRGYVIEGRKIGREMGFPTANIKPANDYKLVPGNGVYAVEVKIDGLNLQGMLSVGSNPTIPGLSGRRSIEVHIFDFERDIYDKEIEVIFRYRLRDEKKFGSIDQLTHQMELDKQKALTLLT